MLSVWRNWKGIVHHELLPPDRTIVSDLYCRQLEQLHSNSKETARICQQKGCRISRWQRQTAYIFNDPSEIERTWLEVLMHPPYSSDLASSDYHLFRVPQNSLNGVKLVSKEACENHMSQFFDQKPQKFYSDGIMALPEKWQKVIENGAYVIS